MACKTAVGSGGAAAGCEEQATRDRLHRSTAAGRKRTELPFTRPALPRHRGNVVFRGPDQGDRPANHAPTQEEVEQEDCQCVSLAANQRDDRRQEVQHESTATEERKEEENRINEGLLIHCPIS